MSKYLLIIILKSRKIKKSQEDRRIKKEIEILSKKTEKKNRSRKDKREAKYRVNIM